MMKKIKVLAAAVILAGATTVIAGLATHDFGRTASAAPKKITGEYVETRTASVFCGPCHYNGEAVTVGKDGLMAWNIDAGTYEGVDLKGMRVVAAVSSSENFNEEGGVRQSELTFNNGTSEKQMAAFTSLLKTRMSKELGNIVAVHTAPVSFIKKDKGFEVTAAGLGEMHVDFRADDSCCVMPSLVWYEPFAPVEHRMVGYTESASYTGSMTDPWHRSAEDSAFYGRVAF